MGVISMMHVQCCAVRSCSEGKEGDCKENLLTDSYFVSVRSWGGTQVATKLTT